MERTQKTLLPFILSPTENNSLNDETEIAAIFCVAELNRAKGGGLFKKQKTEKMVFISKIYYPFWIVPFDDLTILFDGLDLVSYNVGRPSLPDTKTFMVNLSQRTSTREIYATFLSNHLEYFQTNKDEQNKKVDGLISDLDLVKEFLEYTKEATTSDNTVDGVLISPAKNLTQIRENITELRNLFSELNVGLEELNGAIKEINRQTRMTLATLQDKIKAIEKKFRPQIEEAKIALEVRRTRINREYSNKVTKVSNEFEQELLSVHKEIVAAQRKTEGIKSEIVSVENKTRTAIIDKDEVREQKWKEKGGKLKGQLREMAKATKELQKRVDEIEDKKKNVLFHLKQENDAFLSDAGKDVFVLESFKDAETKIFTDEIAKVEDLTSAVVGKIDQLTKITNAAKDQFENLGIRRNQTESLLVYMPFYLICYQNGTNRRCTYVSPSIASNNGIVTRLRSFGKQRITQFLQPRSQKIIPTFNGFLRLLEEDIAFGHEIDEACTKANLIGSLEKVELIRKGLSNLRTKGWLSEKEFESFSNRLL